MGWSLGYDSTWNRDIGYGVPAYCDHPGCTEEINRGLGYVCCESQPYGGEHGCGRYYCGQHEMLNWGPPDCEDEDGEVPRCAHPDDNHISPDHPDWIHHKLTDESWQPWRDKNPAEVAKLLKEIEMPETVDSTSDERVVNNVMRHEYRVLNDGEKADMQMLKDKGLEFVMHLHAIGGTWIEGQPLDETTRQSSRELSLAQTKIEEAVMWAVKHITR